MDTTYRTDLYRLNDANFERFDAKLGQRLAEFRAEIDKRFVELEARFDKRFAALKASIDKRFAEQDARWEKRFGDFRSSLVNWIVALWLTSALGFAGMFFAVMRLR